MPPVKLMDVCIKRTGAVGASGSCLKMFGQEAPELRRLKVKILRKVNSCLWLLLTQNRKQLSPKQVNVFRYTDWLIQVLIKYLRCCLQNRGTMLDGSYWWRTPFPCVGCHIVPRLVHFLQGWNHKHLNITDPRPIESHLSGSVRTDGNSCGSQHIPLEKIEPVALYRWFAVSFGVIGSFLYTVKKIRRGQIPGGEQ